MLRSRQRKVLFILTATESARTPAISTSKFSVRSRWIKLLTSGRNSARQIAPSELSPVAFRKTRFRVMLKEKAEHRAVTFPEIFQLGGTQVVSLSTFI
jgi:hypothetical protein